MLTLATWNIERLKHKSKLSKIQNEIITVDADILVVTEYDEALQLPMYPYYLQTKGIQNPLYKEKPTERRVVVFSKYPIVKQYETYNDEISCAVELKTPLRSLIVYGTIIGITGNRSKDYLTELKLQMEDLERLSKNGNICFVGDYNMSFSDNYYFTKEGRQIIETTFESLYIENVTRELSETIDHIAISENFLHHHSTQLQEWNTEKRLSDHKGISIQLKEIITDVFCL